MEKRGKERIVHLKSTRSKKIVIVRQITPPGVSWTSPKTIISRDPSRNSLSLEEKMRRPKLTKKVCSILPQACPRTKRWVSLKSKRKSTTLASKNPILTPMSNKHSNRARHLRKRKSQRRSAKEKSRALNRRRELKAKAACARLVRTKPVALFSDQTPPPINFRDSLSSLKSLCLSLSQSINQYNSFTYAHFV